MYAEGSSFATKRSGLRHQKNKYSRQQSWSCEKDRDPTLDFQGNRKQDNDMKKGGGIRMERVTLPLLHYRIVGLNFSMSSLASI